MILNLLSPWNVYLYEEASSLHDLKDILHITVST